MLGTLALLAALLVAGAAGATMTDAEAKRCILEKFDFDRDGRIDAADIARAYKAAVDPTWMYYIAWTPQQWLDGCDAARLLADGSAPPPPGPKINGHVHVPKQRPVRDGYIDAEDLDATLPTTCWPTWSHRWVLASICDSLSEQALLRDI